MCNFPMRYLAYDFALRKKKLNDQIANDHFCNVDTKNLV